MRLPFVPTLLVMVLAAQLSGLGIWQLRRADEKAAMLRALSASSSLPEIDTASGWKSGWDFRRARAVCAFDGAPTARAGRDAAGRPGYSYFAACGDKLSINLGWATRPGLAIKLPATATVTGMLRERPGGALSYTLIAEPPLAGLAASRQPTIADIPNNHMGYAVQWFLFAATALVIYAVALWQRQRKAVESVAKAKPDR